MRVGGWSALGAQWGVRGLLGCGLILAGLLLSCTRGQIAGPGTGSDTPNSICGLLVSADGTAAANTLVRLIPRDYNALRDQGRVALALDTTTSAGEYRFDAVDTGLYNIEAVQLSERTRALIYGVATDGDPVRVAAATLRMAGALRIRLPEQTNPLSGYVYVPGTSIAAAFDGERSYVILDSVPVGVVPVIYYAAADLDTGVVIRERVTVVQGDTVQVDNPGWRFSRRLVLNTSPGGAAVADTVTGFPVLVRLHEGNFAFEEAAPGGADLRFTKEDGLALPFEIAGWDEAARRAEIWVRVDTVYGNSASQAIQMYWGNQAAPPLSSPAAVFDSLTGFAAVWHLDSSLADATAAGHHGSDYGTADTAGLIGAARKFDGADSIKVAGLLGTPASVTLSAWVVVDSATYNGGEVLSLGDAVLLRADALNGSNGIEGSFHAAADDSTFSNIVSGRFLAKSGWHHVAYTFDDERDLQTLFIDGVAVKTQNEPLPIIYDSLGTNTLLGTHGNAKTTFGFWGSIDEARVCHRARSTEWLKLCFMNQRADDALVEFR